MNADLKLLGVGLSMPRTRGKGPEKIIGRHVGRHIGRHVGKLKNRSKIDAKMHCILGFIFRTLPDAILNVAIYYAILNVTQMRF